MGTGATSEDWLYRLVLNTACDRAKGKDLLIDEYDRPDGPRHGGSLVQSWWKDVKGLQKIGTAERTALRERLRGHRVYPFGLCSFSIDSDRSEVVLGFVYGVRSGWGSRYEVHGEGDLATLTSDPSGGRWIS